MRAKRLSQEGGLIISGAGLVPWKEKSEHSRAMRIRPPSPEEECGHRAQGFNAVSRETQALEGLTVCETPTVPISVLPTW